jgi:hypothetical protein
MDKRGWCVLYYSKPNRSRSFDMVTAIVWMFASPPKFICWHLNLLDNDIWNRPWLSGQVIREKFAWMGFFSFFQKTKKLMAYTLSHSTSSFLWWFVFCVFFKIGSLLNYLPRVASNLDPLPPRITGVSHLCPAWMGFISLEGNSKAPGPVADACDSSYLGGNDWKDCGWRLDQAKVSKIPSQPISSGWCMPVIPAMWEV